MAEPVTVNPSRLGGGGETENGFSVNTTTSFVAEGRSRTEAELTRALRDRGILAADRLASAPAELVESWLDWFDSQQGAGPGVLFDGIRSGSRPPATPADRSDRAYMERLGRWLSRHVPEAAEHPAAISTLRLLEQRLRDKTLSGPEAVTIIRQRVAVFDAQLAEGEQLPLWPRYPSRIGANR